MTFSTMHVDTERPTTMKEIIQFGLMYGHNVDLPVNAGLKMLMSAVPFMKATSTNSAIFTVPAILNPRDGTEEETHETSAKVVSKTIKNIMLKQEYQGVDPIVSSLACFIGQPSGTDSIQLVDEPLKEMLALLSGEVNIEPANWQQSRQHLSSLERDTRS
jgi:hypothetical protein